MKNQALFSSKDKSKKLKCRLLQFLFGAFRVNTKLNYKNLQMNYSQLSNTDISTIHISNRDISNLPISNTDMSTLLISNRDISNPHIWNTDISEYPLISQNIQ